MRPSDLAPSRSGIGSFRPSSVEQVVDVVREAFAAARPLEIVGGGSKREMGRARDAAPNVLSLAGLSSVLDYAPEELMLTVEPGVGLADAEALLAAHGQRLAFEPPHLGALLGDETLRGTVGGMVAAGLAGPRRFRAGSVRDHVLAVQAVNGRGECFRAGGKVVKNVTGFDLPKLLTAAWGTLAVITEVTLKATPAPASTQTVFIGGLDADRGADALRQAARGPWNVSGAAWLPETLARRTPHPPSLAGTPLTVLRLEGIETSVQARSSALVDALLEGGGEGVAASQEGSDAVTYWRELTRAACLETPREAMVLRASVPPASSAGVLARVFAAIENADGLLDGAGGAVWLSSAPVPAHVRTIRDIVRAAGGQTLVVRAPSWLRAEIEIFEPLPEPLAGLSRRLKAQFDPRGILNPGRMYPDL